MYRKLLSIFALIFFVVAMPVYSQDYRERILNFVSNIMVYKDASIDVVETISVYSNQDKIIHGIVRRLPTRYRDSYGINRYTRYQVEEVLVNNQHSPYHVERYRSHVNIYIGSIDELLTAGNYVYTIHYRVKNAVNFLRDADEFYWNITGNDWDFPILKVEATITLPEGAKILRYSGYTGYKGEKEQNFTVNQAKENQITFVTTKALKSEEGLTVALSWPKGIIIEPTMMQRLKDAIALDKSDFIVLEVFFLVLLYYLIVWYLHGRDPRKSTVIPLFQPPQNLSPAEMRYIYRMGFDLKTYTAGIISLATKGFIKINNEGNVFSVIKQTNSTAKLAPEEKSLADALFTDGKSIELIQANHDTVNRAQQKMKATLAEENRGKYFVTNTLYLIPGIGLSLFAFIAAILSADDKSAAFFAVGWCTIWTFVCLFLLLQAWGDLKRTIAYFSFSNVARSFFSLLFAIPFLIGEVVGIYIFTDTIPIFTTPFLFLIVIMNILFYFLLKRPTVEGQKLRDQINGFKLFLGTTERYRLDKLNPPEMNPSLFEAYLPYAIALDVENAWGERFNEMLRQSSIEPSTYHPTWYTGTTPWAGSTVSAFPSYLGTSLAGALATASLSASSSASSGGGSSGGGGGGGGGGGW